MSFAVHHSGESLNTLSPLNTVIVGNCIPEHSLTPIVFYKSCFPQMEMRSWQDREGAQLSKGDHTVGRRPDHCMYLLGTTECFFL